MSERFECPKCKEAFYKEPDYSRTEFNESSGFNAYSAICPRCMGMAFGPSVSGPHARTVRKVKVVV